MLRTLVNMPKVRNWMILNSLEGNHNIYFIPLTQKIENNTQEIPTINTIEAILISNIIISPVLRDIPMI